MTTTLDPRTFEVHWDDPADANYTWSLPFASATPAPVTKLYEDVLINAPEESRLILREEFTTDRWPWIKLAIVGLVELLTFSGSDSLVGARTQFRLYLTRGDDEVQVATASTLEAGRSQFVRAVELLGEDGSLPVDQLRAGLEQR